jgi:hypothetical protein
LPSVEGNMEIRPDRGSERSTPERRPVRIEVLTYTPTAFYHCAHCEVVLGQVVGVGDRIHREQARESLPEDLRTEFAGVAEWVHRLLERHGSLITIRVIDAASILGFWKALRYQTRRYPAVVVEGTDRYVGAELPLAEADIERRVAAG